MLVSLGYYQAAPIGEKLLALPLPPFAFEFLNANLQDWAGCASRSISPKHRNTYAYRTPLLFDTRWLVSQVLRQRSRSLGQEIGKRWPHCCGVFGIMAPMSQFSQPHTIPFTLCNL